MLPPTFATEESDLEDDDDDDDDDDSRSYVRLLLQLETVTSVLVICPGKQFSFQITTECGYQTTAAYRCWKRIPSGRSCHGEAARTVSKRPCGRNSKITTCC